MVLLVQFLFSFYDCVFNSLASLHLLHRTQSWALLLVLDLSYIIKTNFIGVFVYLLFFPKSNVLLYLNILFIPYASLLFKVPFILMIEEGIHNVYLHIHIYLYMSKDIIWLYCVYI